MMAARYHVKEAFYTLQGEGARSGRAAVFCRFAGCNLWSGLERDRAAAVCSFCDTDFRGTNGVGGGRYASADALAEHLQSLWDAQSSDEPTAHRYCVCTGGEPLLQLDSDLIDALHRRRFEIAVETNGTKRVLPGIDWLCVSPKGRAPLLLTAGQELKLVFPQPEISPERFAALRFEHFFLQPMDGPNRVEATQQALAYCRAHPQWRLSLQLHKLLGIP